MNAYAWQWVLSGLALAAGIIALENLRAWGLETGERMKRTAASVLRAFVRRARGLRSVTSSVAVSWDVEAATPTLESRVAALERAHAKEVKAHSEEEGARRATVWLSAAWATASLVLALAAGLVHPVAE